MLCVIGIKCYSVIMFYGFTIWCTAIFKGSRKCFKCCFTITLYNNDNVISFDLSTTLEASANASFDTDCLVLSQISSY